MMNRRRARKLLVLIPIGILAISLFGFIVMNLWNGLIPALFGGKPITFWQALGMLMLSRILVGGFSRPRVVHKWEQLTPDEREKFRAAMDRRRCGKGGVEPGSAPA
jgi:Ca2+/H+ antiporter, TMEM165/GDT1 family